MTTTDDMRTAVLDALLDVAPEAAAVALDPAVPMAEQLDLDSMDFLAFVEGLAARTGVEVPEADYGRIATLDGCAAYLESARG